MDNTISTMATGLKYRIQSMNITANNLANTETAGFKRSKLQASEFDKYLTSRFDEDQTEIGNGNRGVMAAGVFVDQRRGDLNSTGSIYDLALDGEGYFTLAGAGGGQILTRDGRFRVDNNGYLTDEAGNFVLGQNGNIYVGNASFRVNENGNVTANGNFVDTLRITADGGFTGRIIQGSYERSNVNLIDEMSAMLADSRAFQTYSQIVKRADNILAKTVTEIGRV
jgi:flagellar basal-body rod protein FlgF